LSSSVLVTSRLSVLPLRARLLLLLWWALGLQRLPLVVVVVPLLVLVL
jgi:hypothetical protein